MQPFAQFKILKGDSKIFSLTQINPTEKERIKAVLKKQ